MPWLHVKSPAFSPPSRQDIIIIEASLIIGLIVIALFALQSFNFRIAIDSVIYHFSRFRSLF